ncbi:hypothetical protein [Isoptericola croceus]|uniref:hypothetical protein n=1 Tax=Isoptericola croceus TaxID=3031406 RepID=UPI0023F93F62|nr:hypothetical protein [Isoptericola croceus]
MSIVLTWLIAMFWRGNQRIVHILQEASEAFSGDDDKRAGILRGSIGICISVWGLTIASLTGALGNHQGVSSEYELALVIAGVGGGGLLLAGLLIEWMIINFNLPKFMVPKRMRSQPGCREAARWRKGRGD